MCCWLSIGPMIESWIMSRCPFPIGWLINRGVCLPLEQQVNDDRWYTKPAPLFLPKGHVLKIIGYPANPRKWPI